MSIIAERTAHAEQAIAAVKDHCMCAKFEIDNHYAMVIYPAGDFAVDGCRVSLAMGKAKALELLLAKMERHWIESYP